MSDHTNQLTVLTKTMARNLSAIVLLLAVVLAPAMPASAAGVTLDSCKNTVIRYGSKNLCVRVAQNQLNTFSYCMTGTSPLKVDGVFGGATRTLTRNFQSYVNISPDGVIGPITWEYLRYPCSHP